MQRFNRRTQKAAAKKELQQGCHNNDFNLQQIQCPSIKQKSEKSAGQLFIEEIMEEPKVKF